MHSLSYSELVNNHLCFHSANEASEKKNAYHILTERHLQAMWLEQKYFHTLKTSEGQTIEVISPGIWNSEAGPDFLKAHLKIGNQEYKGDIEIHLFQEGWQQHHHHTDPNYDHVILHLCYWESLKSYSTLTSKGKAIPSIFLKPFLKIPETRIIKLIDLDLYPYKHFAGTGKCSHELFKHLPQDKKTALFRSAALWRLKEKYERLMAKCDHSQDILLGGISMVLGYKHNAESFFSIYQNLKNQENSSHSFLAQALGMSHFFDPFFQKKWANSMYYQTLKKEYANTQSTQNLINLKLHNIRPANHPVRRLALMSKIMCDPKIWYLESEFKNLWHSSWEQCRKEGWKEFKKTLLKLIPTYQDDYWEYHYTFESIPQKKPVALVGEDLKWKILINVCLPILYAEIEQQAAGLEKEAFYDFYASIPASKSRKSTYLNFRFFDEKQKGLKFTRADIQQGAYQIHRDFCFHYEASCQGCPFVERYVKAFG